MKQKQGKKKKKNEKKGIAVIIAYLITSRPVP